MGIIDERTKIPLFAVLSASTLLVGAVAWATTIYVKVEAAEVMNEKQDVKIEGQMVLLLDIRDRLIRLESAKGGKNE